MVSTVNSLRPLILALFCMFFAGACSPFVTTTPQGFASFGGVYRVRSISPDQVVYQVRIVKNKPYAEFDFWREALPERMKGAGYRIVTDSVVIIKEKKALLLEMMSPIGESDYSYMVMMTVKKKSILLAEAAGVVGEFRNRRESIIAALYKTSLK